MKQPIEHLNSVRRQVRIALVIMVLLVGGAGWWLWINHKSPVPSADAVATSPQALPQSDEVVDGIHIQNGLAEGPGYREVLVNCTACHSAQLVTQNRGDRNRWEQIIRWMQETQGLWDLGDNESVILDYLAANYPPEVINRRMNLDQAAIEWFVLSDGSDQEDNQ